MRSVTALKKHGNTIVVAPTGAGKTIMLSFQVGALKPQKALVLQHRDELVEQNMGKFQQVNTGWPVSVYNAGAKSWRGRAVFAMVQTLSRPNNLDTIPKGLDLVVVDECHHIAAASYLKIIDAVKSVNPGCMVAGWTATPKRADNKGLRSVFNNCADQITIRELIDLGFLVPPRGFIVSVDEVHEELAAIRRTLRTTADFNPEQVEKILNKEVVNSEVVRKWKEEAGDRKSIVFCSTLQHAKDVLKEFCDAGIKAEMVSGNTPKSARKALVRAFKHDRFQVLVNVGVLVEGFDEPTVGCVVLLRACSFKSTMIQMIGRGLRPVNAVDHPGVVKRDCKVIDFGASLLTHGDIDAEVELGRENDIEREPGEAPVKICPVEGSELTPYVLPDGNGRYGCGAEVPAGVLACPFCGFMFEKPAGEGSGDAIELTEIDLLNRSPFRWVDLFDNGRVVIASGFDSWSCVASPDGDNWYSLGKAPDTKAVQKLGISGKPQAVAMADDFLRQHETGLNSNKARRWLTDPATVKQGHALQRMGYKVEITPFGCIGFTKLTATAHLNFAWNRHQIERLLDVA